ncbi:MAG: DUF768 domain-containing protein, partial [Mesorhizobium sp.]
HQWLANAVPDVIGADVISVSELAQKLLADAKSLGISSRPYETILDAIVHHDAGR